MTQLIARQWLLILLIAGLLLGPGFLPSVAEASRKCQTCNQYCSSPQCVYCDDCCWKQLKQCQSNLNAWITYANKWKDETKRLEKEIGEISADRDGYKTQLECCRGKLCEAEMEILYLRSELWAVEREIARLAGALASCEENLKIAGADLKRVTDERNGAWAQIEQLKAAVKDEQDKYVKLQGELDTLKGTLATRDKELVASQIELGKSTVWIIALAVVLIVVVLFLFCCIVVAVLIIGRSERDAAVAYEKALGATREMAANKKDCCHCQPHGPAVVYGPITTTPNGPVTTESSDPTFSTNPNGPTTTCIPNGPGHSTSTASPTPVSTTTPTPTTVVPTTTKQETQTPNGPSHVTSAPTPSAIAAPTPNAVAAPDAGAGAASTGTAAADSDAKGGDAQAFAF